jgi:hypothetical protein
MTRIEVLQCLPKDFDVFGRQNSANIEIPRDESRAVKYAGKAPYNHEINAGVS